MILAMFVYWIMYWRAMYIWDKLVCAGHPIVDRILFIYIYIYIYIYIQCDILFYTLNDSWLTPCNSHSVVACKKYRYIWQIKPGIVWGGGGGVEPNYSGGIGLKAYGLPVNCPINLCPFIRGSLWCTLMKQFAKSSSQHRAVFWLEVWKSWTNVQ